MSVARLLFALGLGLVMTGCRKSAPPPPPPPPLPTLGEVVIRDATAPQATAVAAVDTGALSQALRSHLLASGIVSAGADGGAGPGQGGAGQARLRGEIALDGAEVPGKALARAVVRLQLDSRPSDAPRALDEQLQGQGEQTYTLPTGGTVAQATNLRREIFTKLVLRIAGELLDGAAARLRLRDAPASAVHAALAADGGELREEAIRQVGQRQLRDEVPRLLGLLDDNDEPTRDAALGALIALKEPRAVTALTKSRSLRDRHEMRKILEAVSILGGQEALDYLSFVADSHDDEEIRTQAADARRRLARRMDAGAGIR